MELTAQYKCRNCFCEFDVTPPPNMGTCCPLCGGLQITWINAKEIVQASKGIRDEQVHQLRPDPDLP